jgi:hypothetical protein
MADSTDAYEGGELGGFFPWVKTVKFHVAT